MKFMLFFVLALVAAVYGQQKEAQKVEKRGIYGYGGLGYGYGHSLPLAHAPVVSHALPSYGLGHGYSFAAPLHAPIAHAPIAHAPLLSHSSYIAPAPVVTKAVAAPLTFGHHYGHYGYSALDHFGHYGYGFH